LLNQRYSGIFFVAAWLVAGCALDLDQDPHQPRHLHIRNYIQMYPDRTNTTWLMTIPVFNNGAATSPPSTLQVDLDYTATPAGTPPRACHNTYTLAVPSLSVGAEWTSPELVLGTTGSCGCIPGRCKGSGRIHLSINNVDLPYANLCNTTAFVDWHFDGQTWTSGLKNSQEECEGF
jgi:hypothetical protein